MRRLVALLVLIGCLSGCAVVTRRTTLAEDVVRADVEFESVLGDRIESYILADGTLTQTEREALQLALQAWRAMVRRAAAANGIIVP